MWLLEMRLKWGNHSGYPEKRKVGPSGSANTRSKFPRRRREESRFGQPKGGQWAGAQKPRVRRPEGKEAGRSRWSQPRIATLQTTFKSLTCPYKHGSSATGWDYRIARSYLWFKSLWVHCRQG